MRVGEEHRRPRRTRYQAFVLLVKKLIAFLFSHVGLCALVVAYTMLGSVMFRAIEQEHERVVHRYVRDMRSKAVNEIWKATYTFNVQLNNWTSIATQEVLNYKEVLKTLIKKGYDANDHQENTQWTFAGAFLYSLTVVTTIGYGNIACQTHFGRAMTILYAILGIPLMLLFLTNIGDVMAKIFRFLYSESVRLQLRLRIWHKRRKASQLRRQTSVKTAAKALQQIQQQQLQTQQQIQSPTSPRPPDRKHHPRTDKRNQKVSTVSQFRLQQGVGSTSSQNSSLQLLQHQHLERNRSGSGQSAKTPRLSPRANHMGTQGSQDSFPGAIGSLPSQSSTQATATAAAIEQLALEQMRLEELAQKYEMQEESLRELTEDKLSKVMVPLWLVFSTMLAYLVCGAVLFSSWESDWGLWGSFYFCYVSLATIGFGDLFPGDSLKDESADKKMAITSFYLLLGMALIAMCFNLAQEEVVSKMTRLAEKLGIIQSSNSDAGDSVCETET